MERLQRQLFEAAATGNVSSLRQLRNEDPLLLERVTPYYNSETALHVSALLGHLDFVKEIIGIKSELTNELNSQQSSPLHLASAKGHVNVVRELLSVVGHETMCLARDKDGLTPLHLAAMKGRVEVMELLLGAQPEATRLTLYGGETILHLCVKNWQVEALKLLVSSVSDPEFIKAIDGEGNTLLHLAVEYKQVESIKLLVNNGAANEVDVNAVNHKGLTAMDVLIRSRSDVRDSEIRESLNGGGAAGASMADRRIHKHHPLEKYIRDFGSAIMVVASVVATMAFQVALSPPGGVWQDTNLLINKDRNAVDHPLGNRVSHAVDSQNITLVFPHVAGSSILATYDLDALLTIFDYNNVAFYCSIGIILIMLSGFFTVKRGFFSFILITVSVFALSGAVATYTLAVRSWMPFTGDYIFHHVPIPFILIGSFYFMYMVMMSIQWIISRRKSAAAGSAVPQNNTSIV